MRAWFLAALFVLLGSLVSAEVPVAGFDHNLHERDVSVAGRDPIACTNCHAIRNGALIGRPDHAACFGVCHGTLPAKVKNGAAIAVSAEQKRICVNCHAETALAARMGQKLAVPFPPYLPTDFALSMPHKVHNDVACASCHFLASKPPPHRRCAGCHDGTRAAAMTKCASCHTPGSGSPLPPHMTAPINTVVSAFSHPKHAARGAAGAACNTCHQEILDTNDSILPRPKQASCAVDGCHDGKATFSVTLACTKCHTAPPPWKFDVERPPDRFSHTAPHHAGAKLACAACHPLATSGEVLVAGHAACAGCHEPRFGERHRPSDPIDPKAPKQICGACHNATEPWRKLTADRPPPDRTEFGATLSHDKHSADCKLCHSLATTTSQLRPPRGHRSCTGTACHAVKGGPEPQLTACESCHELGLAAKRVAVRITLPWSVRATFDHAPHRMAKDGSEVPCARCHEDLHADSLEHLAAPSKATCQPCHDGATAFKLTGTTCTRCHSGANAGPQPRL